jgi:hypothetical protein
VTNTLPRAEVSHRGSLLGEDEAAHINASCLRHGILLESLKFALDRCEGAWRGSTSMDVGSKERKTQVRTRAQRWVAYTSRH